MSDNPTTHAAPATTAKLPALLAMPPKMIPVIHRFNDYKIFNIYGGRASAKSHSIARLLLYIASTRKVRVLCGREIQESIEDSVYTLLKDYIEEFQLPFTITQKYIEHRVTGSRFRFKGLNDSGAKAKTKGFEGFDILWVDEAQALSQETIRTLVPTLRKDNVRLIFTWNPHMYNDPIAEFTTNRPDTLSIPINYTDNPFCPNTIKVEAEILRSKSEREYNHVYLGQPLAASDDLLFDFEHIRRAFHLEPYEDITFKGRVLGIDFAAQGNDSCVATILDRVSATHWQATAQEVWDEPDAMVSVGRIIDLIGRHRPDVSILDVGGMGYVVLCRLQEMGIDIKPFDGASTERVDTNLYVNARAAGYYEVKDWLSRGWLSLKRCAPDLEAELRTIRMKFRSDGRRILQRKDEIKRYNSGKSPDRADSLMMAVWGAIHYLGKTGVTYSNAATITRNNARRDPTTTMTPSLRRNSTPLRRR